MSAGAPEPRATRDLGLLAPKFRQAVEAALAECHAEGLDAMVFETYRSKELQEHYYARGRTVKPPNRIVTKAKSNLKSWHGYGLAVDVISKSKLWGADPDWWPKVAAIFKRHGCDWGGDWRQKDYPHMQWCTLKASPSDRARELLAEGGMERVWSEVGAI